VVRGLDVWDELFLDCYFRCVDRKGLRLGLRGAVAYCNKVCYEEVNRVLGRK